MSLGEGCSSHLPPLPSGVQLNSWFHSADKNWFCVPDSTNHCDPPRYLGNMKWSWTSSSCDMNSSLHQHHRNKHNAQVLSGNLRRTRSKQQAGLNKNLKNLLFRCQQNTETVDLLEVTAKTRPLQVGERTGRRWGCSLGWWNPDTQPTLDLKLYVFHDLKRWRPADGVSHTLRLFTTIRLQVVKGNPERMLRKTEPLS